MCVLSPPPFRFRWAGITMHPPPPPLGRDCSGPGCKHPGSPYSHPAGHTGGTNTASDLSLWLGHALEPPCCDHEVPPAGLGDGIQMGLQVRQLPQRSTFQDPASGRGGVSVPNEKNIRDASSQELNKSRAQTAPSFCSIFVAPGC